MVSGSRRMGVIVSKASSIEEARKIAENAYDRMMESGGTLHRAQEFLLHCEQYL